MQERRYAYLSPVFCTSMPTIHWSYTIRCHISFTDRADIDTDRTVLLVSCLAAKQGPKNRADLIVLYCMASSVRGQDESNPVMRLAVPEWARWSYLTCSGILAISCKKNFPKNCIVSHRKRTCPITYIQQGSHGILFYKYMYNVG